MENSNSYIKPQLVGPRWLKTPGVSVSCKACTYEHPCREEPTHGHTPKGNPPTGQRSALSLSASHRPRMVRLKGSSLRISPQKYDVEWHALEPPRTPSPLGVEQDASASDCQGLKNPQLWSLTLLQSCCQTRATFGSEWLQKAGQAPQTVTASRRSASPQCHWAKFAPHT